VSALTKAFSRYGSRAVNATACSSMRSFCAHRYAPRNCVCTRTHTRTHTHAHTYSTHSTHTAHGWNTQHAHTAHAMSTVLQSTSRLHRALGQVTNKSRNISGRSVQHPATAANIVITTHMARTHHTYTTRTLHTAGSAHTHTTLSTHTTTAHTHSTHSAHTWCMVLTLSCGKDRVSTACTSCFMK